MVKKKNSKHQKQVLRFLFSYFLKRKRKIFLMLEANKTNSKAMLE
jgi:hypothetical protein